MAIFYDIDLALGFSEYPGADFNARNFFSSVYVNSNFTVKELLIKYKNNYKHYFDLQAFAVTDCNLNISDFDRLISKTNPENPVWSHYKLFL